MNILIKKKNFIKDYSLNQAKYFKILNKKNLSTFVCCFLN